MLLCIWAGWSGLKLFKFVNRFKQRLQESRLLVQCLEFCRQTEVRLTEDMGRGVFAIEQLEPFQLLTIYDGERISPFAYRQKLKKFPEAKGYIWTISDRRIVDPTDDTGTVSSDSKNRAPLINEPPQGSAVNVIPIVTDNYIWMVSIESIESGQQLYTTYGPRYERSYASELSDHHGRVMLTEQQQHELRLLAERCPLLKTGIEIFLSGAQ